MYQEKGSILVIKNTSGISRENKGQVTRYPQFCNEVNLCTMACTRITYYLIIIIIGVRGGAVG